MATEKINKPKTAAPKTYEVTVLTVSDLHQSRILYEELVRAIAKHKPDVVAFIGDFLHAGDDFEDRLSLEECAAIISALPPKVVFARGNHEDENWVEFAKHWKSSKKPLIALNGETFKFGPLVMVGFPCMLGDETHFLEGREPLPYDTDDWLMPLIRMHGAPARSLWLVHEPPRGTPLSCAGSVVEGHQEWTDAIERFNPILVIAGHDHITPIKNSRWHCKIKNTTCVNVGQSAHGPLHFTIIKATFLDGQPCLPSRIQIKAYPAGETVCV
jgi:Icc-related predicted phosphoesterase